MKLICMQIPCKLRKYIELLLLYSPISWLMRKAHQNVNIYFCFVHLFIFCLFLSSCLIFNNCCSLAVLSFFCAKNMRASFFREAQRVEVLSGKWEKKLSLTKKKKKINKKIWAPTPKKYVQAIFVPHKKIILCHKWQKHFNKFD